MSGLIGLNGAKEINGVDEIKLYPLSRTFLKRGEPNFWTPSLS